MNNIIIEERKIEGDCFQITTTISKDKINMNEIILFCLLYLEKKGIYQTELNIHTYLTEGLSKLEVESIIKHLSPTNFTELIERRVRGTKSSYELELREDIDVSIEYLKAGTRLEGGKTTNIFRFKILNYPCNGYINIYTTCHNIEEIGKSFSNLGQMLELSRVTTSNIFYKEESKETLLSKTKNILVS